jgi:hypothetical protein
LSLVICAKNEVRVSAFYRRTLILDWMRAAAETTAAGAATPVAGWRCEGRVRPDGCDPEGNVMQFTQDDA